MDCLQENKELYNQEIEYSYQKNSKIEVYLTFLTILGTGEILLIKSLLPISICWWWIIYTTLVVISSICFINCMIKFYSAFNSYPYSYVNISEINKQCSIFSNTLKEQGKFSKVKIGELTEKLYCKMLSDSYLNCALQNRNTNISKQENHEKFIKAFLEAIIVLIVAFIFNTVIVHIQGGSLYVR